MSTPPLENLPSKGTWPSILTFWLPPLLIRGGSRICADAELPLTVAHAAPDQTTRVIPTRLSVANDERIVPPWWRVRAGWGGGVSAVSALSPQWATAAS